MSNPPKIAKPQRKSALHAAARLRKTEREQKIMSLLNAGVSIPEIAGRQGVTERRIRQRVQEILAKRAPSAPLEFAALQVSRLNEALLVAYSAMASQNLGAVDRVVKIVRELDRYHGLASPDFADAPEPPRRLTRERPPLALPAREEALTPEVFAESWPG
jgi:hypothetical protein